MTLAECLVLPFRSGNVQAQQNFYDHIVSGKNTTFFPLDAEEAQQAASLRARYHLTLTDAFQISAALAFGCDAFLTNDVQLKRVTELRVLIIDELEL